MRLLKLNLDGNLEPMIAIPVEKNNNLYYNIFHGDPKCWEFRCSVDSRLASVKKEKTLILKEDHFIIREIKDNGILRKDIKGNGYYVISKDSDDIHKLDVLLFWTIDPSLIDVDYGTKGFGKILGHGCVSEKENIVPSPVIEIYGDCKIYYSGITIDGVKVKVTYEYKHEQSILKRI